ncbi:transporter [Streptomyces eurocidicus]|uniref:Putative MFS family arabinose efflux permease n=1 Tax=Streptomyces eurocidicus TaxID=66423 RepID=A0A2N8NXQ4_STREU|nr:MFS transporter [Streptomyces eurocidicus]MBB5122889.1 putative MFS family arabinose efflux permease [Streptomyces eurocidicus]MBF6056320.1 MFS transporter [Streptomyces eurocidicus]PNE33548.1 transporter [Streptomyces eurocidicus]
MTSVASPSPATGTGRSPVKGWFAVAAVTLGIFCLMTSELLPVGLLTPVGDALHVSEGTAGLMVTVPGLVAALSAPIVTVATGRIDRRIVLGVLVGLVGAANLASAFADHFAIVLGARFLVGIAVGGFWAIAGGIALRLVPEEHVGRAMAIIFGGVETASVLGVPTGTLLGDLSGWRTAFAAVGGLGLTALVLMVFLLPPLPADESLTFAELPRIFKSNRGVRIGIAITFLLITGHFVAYTFVRPILQDAGISGNRVSMMLLIFGVAGIIGNFLAGAKVGQHVRTIVLAISVVLTAAMVLFAVTGGGLAVGIALLVLWGLGYGAVPVSLQTWILKAAPDATEAASSLYVSMFNFSIALGALIGGLAFDSLAMTSVLWIGAALAVLTLAVAGGRTKGLLSTEPTAGH